MDRTGLGPPPGMVTALGIALTSIAAPGPVGALTATILIAVVGPNDERRARGATAPTPPRPGTEHPPAANGRRQAC